MAEKTSLMTLNTSRNDLSCHHAWVLGFILKPVKVPSPAINNIKIKMKKLLNDTKKQDQKSEKELFKTLFEGVILFVNSIDLSGKCTLSGKSLQVNHL